MKVTPTKPSNTVTFQTKDKKDSLQIYPWWKAGSQDEAVQQLLTTAAFLKETQGHRYRQAALYARLYGNHSLFSFIGANMNKVSDSSGLPSDRPTFNLIQSAADTLISRISQDRPAPIFLTDGSNYKERRLAKQLNNFIQGEFHRLDIYELATVILRDALVEGTGCLKIYQTQDNKVGVERKLLTELLVDPSEAMYGKPRQLYELKLVDRQVLKEQCPSFKATIEKAEKAYPDSSADASKTVSDLVMVVEGWHLPSAPGAKDGRHMIACSAGKILDEDYTKDKFPFVFLHYSPRMMGFWAQGLAEQLMGTQMEINSLLYTITRAIKLVGVPRVFIEDGSKVVKSAQNNDVGVLITYRGVKPEYQVAPCNAPELYEQLNRLIDYGYRQCGVSTMQAAAQKPGGLDSGEAIRSYNEISTDRYASLSRRYDNLFVDLTYAITDMAKDIAEETGSYSTVYPNKDGTKEIDLPKMDILKNDYIVQCFNMSSLPKEPAGRMAKVTEMIQAGMITVKEGRRLLDYPDLEQIEKLANASEERIYQALDKIIEDGDYTPPDPFMDLALAKELVVQYYNLYVAAKLEEDKAQQLRDFFDQTTTLLGIAQPPQPPGVPPAQPTPQANPQALPTSPLVPNAVQGAA